MLDEELSADYKGYTIVITATSTDDHSFDSTVFTVGLRGQVIVSGTIRETFKSAQEGTPGGVRCCSKVD